MEIPDRYLSVSPRAQFVTGELASASWHTTPADDLRLQCLLNNCIEVSPAASNIGHRFSLRPTSSAHLPVPSAFIVLPAPFSVTSYPRLPECDRVCLMVTINRQPALCLVGLDKVLSRCGFMLAGLWKTAASEGGEWNTHDLGT